MSSMLSEETSLISRRISGTSKPCVSQIAGKRCASSRVPKTSPAMPYHPAPEIGARHRMKRVLLTSKTRSSTR